MCEVTQGEAGHLVSHIEKSHGEEPKISITCPFDGYNYSRTKMKSWKSHNYRVQNQKKESKLTNADRGEIFESDVDVELDNNKHVDDDFKFNIVVAKELMSLESKRKISKIVHFVHFCAFKKT